MPTCKTCGQEFERKRGPNSKYNGPPPTWCPDCDRQRRIARSKAYYHKHRDEILKRQRESQRQSVGASPDGWPEKQCELPGCGVVFKPYRRDTRFCSKACQDFITSCRRYNMHPIDYRNLLESNDGRCWNPNCNREATDTDHYGGDYFTETIVVRGRLCGHCNKAEGLLGTPEAAVGLATYVQQPELQYLRLPVRFQKRRKKMEA